MEKPSISSDLIRGHIDTIILHVLSFGDKFAQQISDEINVKSENKYQINQATLYSSLKRLENLKFVRSYWNDGGDGRRKFFKITEKGLETVNENINSWASSKVIIDKLTDTYSEPIIITHNYTQINEEKPSENVVIKEDFNSREIKPEIIVDNSVRDVARSILFPEKSQNVIDLSVLNQKDVNTEKELDSPTEKPVVNLLDNENANNFRILIGNLIKESEKNLPKKEIHKEKLQIIEKKEEFVDYNEVAKFNESLKSEDFNSHKVNNNGKIDFGDLTIMAKKQGFKLKISSKTSYKQIGDLLVNKLHFFVCFTLLILSSIIFGGLCIGFGTEFVSMISSIIFISLVGLLFVISSLKFLIDPRKISTKKYSLDLIKTSFIIVVNLLIINLALLFLLSIDLSIKINLVSYLVLPLVLYLNVVLYFGLLKTLSSKKFFKTK